MECVINCTDPQSDMRKLNQALIKNLITKNYIQPDALSLGIDALSEGNILHSDKKKSEILFALGTYLRGVLGKSTAVPELSCRRKN